MPGTIATLLLIAYAVASPVSLAMYWWDKRSAKKKRWRTKEKTLHTVDVLGGWPGGLLAQRLFRHKNRKGPFQLVFWMTVLLHVLLWLALAFWWTTR